MKNALAVAVAVAGMCFSVAECPGQEDAGVTATVCGISIAGLGYEDRNIGLQPSFYGPGTKLSVMLRSAGKEVVFVDTDASRIQSFVDNEGTDILYAAKGARKLPLRLSPFGRCPRFSSDRKAAIFEINGLGVPSKQAIELVLKGTVKVTLAAGKKSF